MSQPRNRRSPKAHLKGVVRDITQRFAILDTGRRVAEGEVSGLSDEFVGRHLTSEIAFNEAWEVIRAGWLQIRRRRERPWLS